MRFWQKALGFNELKHKFKYGFIWKGNDKINKKSALVHDTENFIAVPSQLRSLCQPICESLKHEPGKMLLNGTDIAVIYGKKTLTVKMALSFKVWAEC